MAPGVYDGDIVLTVTDRIPLGTYPFRAGLCVMDGAYVPEMSVKAAVEGGSYDDHKAQVTVNNTHISTRGAARSTMFLAGHCDVTVNDSVIESKNGVLPPDYIDTVPPALCGRFRGCWASAGTAGPLIWRSMPRPISIAAP